MKKTALILILALITIMALVSVPAYAGIQDKLTVVGQGKPTIPAPGSTLVGGTIQILNNTGYPIYHLYIAPSDASDWGNDLLGPAEAIANGATYDTGIRPGSGIYDIWCVDSDGDSYYKWDVSFQRSNVVEFTFMDVNLGGMAIGSINWAPTIKITNNTGFTIYYLYMAPTSHSRWGDDLLGPMTIPHGQTFDTGVPAGTTRYDIRLVDEDGDTYTKWDVDVSQSAAVEFTIWDIDIDLNQLMGSATTNTLTVFNATGYAIKELYVSSTDSDSWGQNWLQAGKTIPDKGYFDVTVSGSQTIYDLKAVDSYGNRYFRWDMDLSQLDWIVLSDDDL